MEKNHRDSSLFKWALIAVFLIAAMIRVYLAPLPGNVSDMDHFVRWTKAATQDGVPFVYATTHSDYPPGLFYFLKPVGWIYHRFFSSSFDDTTTLRTLLKFPAVVADLATAALLFLFLRKWKSERIAFWVATSYALNPAVIYESAYWGQVDAVNTLFMVASVLFLMRRKIELSWVALTIAFLIKMHAVVVAPVIFFASLKYYPWKRILKAAVLSSLAAIILLSPFIYHNQIDRAKDAYTTAVARYPYVSVNAFNLWWLSQPLKVQKMEAPYYDGRRDDVPVLAGITCKQFGFLALGIFTLLTIVILNRTGDPYTIAFAAFALTFAFYVLPTEIHERYMFPALAFLSVVYCHNRRFIMMYAALTLTFLINLQVLPFSDPRSALLTRIISAPAAVPFLSTITALLNVIIFCYLIFYIFGELTKGPRTLPSN